MPLRFVIGEMSASVEVSLGRQGGLVIPVPLLRALELEEGHRLVARQQADLLMGEVQIWRHSPQRQGIKTRGFIAAAAPRLMNTFLRLPARRSA